MKHKLFAKILIALSLAIGTNFSLIRAGYTQDITFFCGRHRGEIATMARTRSINIAIVLWRSEHFSDSGYTPERRCQMVAIRFQTNHDNGNLKYVTTGTLDRSSIVCAVREKGGECDGHLFTLMPNADHNQFITITVERGDSSDEIYTFIEGRGYFDINKYIEDQIVTSQRRYGETATIVIEADILPFMERGHPKDRAGTGSPWLPEKRSPFDPATDLYFIWQ